MSEYLHYTTNKDKSLTEIGLPLLILLHGYGSNEKDLIGLAAQLQRDMQVVSIRAPFSLGQESFAWFDIERTQENIRFDFEQAMASLVKIEILVEKLKSENKPSHCLIAGFSQGATMALAAGLKSPTNWSGVAMLSGLYGREMQPQNPESVRGLSVFVSHGTMDEIIPIDQARFSKKLMLELPINLEYQEYVMGHTIDSACLSRFSDWINERLEAE